MNENNDKLNILQSELSIIISQQEIISQKCSILLALNTLLATFLVTITIYIGFNIFILIITLLQILSMLLCAYIIWPQFKSSKESKYWYDFAKMKDDEILEIIFDSENLLGQIKINSKITTKKYELFSYSLGITLLFVPFIIGGIFKIFRLLFRKKRGN